MFLSLVPSVCDAISAIEAESELRDAMGVLLPVARMLASGQGIPGSIRRSHARALRAEVYALRSAFAERIQGRPLAEPGYDPVRSTAFARDASARGLETDMLESLVGALDLGRLVDVLDACSEEVLRTIAEELETVSNLLDVSLAKEHVLPPGSERVSYPELVEEAARSCWDMARNRGVAVACSVTSTSGSGDPDMIRRALTTLLHEAIASSPEGASIVLDVSGESIPVVELAMESPMRAKTDRTAMGGLELAFASAVVRAHGGDLQQSEAGGRTFVRFALPRRVESMRRAA